MEGLLRMALDLVDVMVLSGLLKTSLVEARMKMETGGLLRQALRIGLYFQFIMSALIRRFDLHFNGCNKISSKAIRILYLSSQS